jgi:hypothetical protein
MTGLSRRERFLIFMTALLMPPILIYVLLITPMQLQIIDNRALLENLEFTKIQINANLTTIPTYRLRKEDRMVEVDLLFENFASPIHEAEFERWILPLFTKYKVDVSNVSLSDTRVATLMIPVVVANKPIYNLLLLINDFNKIQAVNDINVPLSSTQLLFAEYTYDFTTSYENYMKILDEIKAWDTSFVVSNTSYTFEDKEASLTIHAYSVHKLSFEQLLEIYLHDFGIHPNEMLGPSVPENPK